MKTDDEDAPLPQIPHHEPWDARHGAWCAKLNDLGILNLARCGNCLPGRPHPLGSTI